ncbi:MAG: xanthine dehydrogenase family protein molybdopterin-binding subunit, partial [Actinomycetota bacterium]
MTNPILGRVVRRIEDPRFLTGRGRYVETLRPKGALRAVFVRSIIAHGRLEGVDVDAASSMPGVVAVLTAADLSLPDRPPADDVEGPFDRPVPASGTVRYVGEPVVLVLAETLGQASDAAENVVAHVEPLDVVVGVDAALADGASLLFADAGTNVAYAFESAWEENVLDGSDVVVRVRVEHQRLAPSPMETNGIVVEPHDEGLKVWVPSQVPFDVRSEIAEVIGLDEKAVHVVAPDVGGGFGNKAYVYPEHLMCAAAAMRLGRAVAWQETRSESFVGLNHGRAQIHDVELGARRDGTIVGLRVDIVSDMGAYPIGAYLPVTTSSMLPGPYMIPRVAYRGRAVVTNAVPVWAYRGAGRPEAAASLERAIDVLADELGVDPIELRRRNAIRRDQFPFTSVTGEVYDTGDYDRALDEVTRLAGYT